MATPAPKMPGRFLNRASGKMETAKAMKGYRGGKAATRVPAAARALGAPRAQIPWQQINPLTANPGEIQRYSQGLVGSSTQAELGPLRQRQGELSNTEATVAKRYGGYGEATQNLLGGIQSGAEQSAKTAANEAAESALRNAKQIETTGQNATTLNAGYMDPQLRQALQGQQANVQEIGQAREGAAASQGTNEANYMANLRAAAAQRVTEGQKGIASTYGAQKAAVGSKENELIARQPGAISKLQTELLQKQFTNRATEQGLGIKLGGIQQKETASRRGAETSRRGQNLTRTSAQEGAAQRERASERTAQTAEQNRIFKASHATGGKPGKPPKAPSPAEGRKYMGNVSKAEGIAQQQLGPQKYDHTRQEQVRQYLRGLGYNDDQVSAALNIAVYGKLGPQDRKTAEAYGLKPAYRKQWFS